MRFPPYCPLSAVVLKEKADLDQMIDDAAELVKNHYKLDDIADPGATTEVCP